MIIKINNTLNFKTQTPFELDISDKMQKDIERCWNEFIENKENYWNGDIFVATNIDLNNNTIEVGKTKYASLVYAKHNKDLIIKPLFSAILLKTKDNKYVIIKNNHNNINIIGGMADSADFKNGKFSPDACLHREVLEETGIDINNNSQVLEYNMKYLKVQDNNKNYGAIGVLYTGTLNFTSEEFKEYVSCNKFDGEIKEWFFYDKEDCLNLKLKDTDISYLKEFIKIETSQEGTREFDS